MLRKKKKNDCENSFRENEGNKNRSVITVRSRFWNQALNSSKSLDREHLLFCLFLNRIFNFHYHPGNLSVEECQHL